MGKKQKPEPDIYVDRRPPNPPDRPGRLLLMSVVGIAVVGVMIGGAWSLLGGKGLFQSENPRELASAPVETESAEDEGPAADSASPTPAPEPTETASASPEPTPSPTPTPVVTPAAPASNELVSGQWLLSPYAIVKDEEMLVVTGTLQNLGTEAASAEVRVFVYVDGRAVATAEGVVQDIPGESSTPVTLPTDSTWVPGTKVLFVDVQPLTR